jgi:hypothetical protein
MEITIKIPEAVIRTCNIAELTEAQSKSVIKNFLTVIMNDGYGQFNTDLENYLSSGEYDAENDTRYEDIIERIKTIIKNHGEFTVADVVAESSPVISSLGNTHQLAEQFGHDKVTAVLYVNDTETDEDFISYYNLEYEVLEQILWLAEIWEAESLIDEKRISN